MTPPLAVGFLSRSRLPELRRAVNSLLATVGMPVKIVVAFDDDADSFNAYTPPAHVWKTLLKPRHHYVRGMNALYESLKQNVPDFDHFVVSNDDVEFFGTDWGPAFCGLFAELWPDDGLGVIELLAHDKCAHYMSRRAFFDQHFDGRLADPAYTMYCSDTEMLQRLRAMGRHRWVHTPHAWPGAVCVHHELTDTLRYTTRIWYNRDLAIYNQRAKANGWPEVLVKE